MMQLRVDWYLKLWLFSIEEKLGYLQLQKRFVVGVSLSVCIVQISKKASSAVFGEDSFSCLSSSSLVLLLCLMRAVNTSCTSFHSGCLRFLFLELLLGIVDVAELQADVWGVSGLLLQALDGHPSGEIPLLHGKDM